MNHNTSTRRDVLAGLAVSAGAVITASTGLLRTAAAAETAPQAAATQPEFYELRALRLRRGTMGKRLDDYLKSAFIPAARRAGCGPIGTFNVTIGPANPSVYVLVPHPTLESFVSLRDKLSDDAEYRKAAQEFRALPATDPPYVNQEVQLLRAFPHVAKMEVPEAKPRIFELRVYRSHSLAAAKKKIEMFDTAGEIDIFRRAGLAPVFFAQNLTGNTLPCLTYMLTFPDLATREKNWKAFVGDPDWKKLSATPGFTDVEIVVDIHNQILTPTPYSQV